MKYHNLYFFGLYFQKIWQGMGAMEKQIDLDTSSYKYNTKGWMQAVSEQVERNQSSRRIHGLDLLSISPSTFEGIFDFN